jgi:hypothetical protein
MATQERIFALPDLLNCVVDRYWAAVGPCPLTEQTHVAHPVTGAIDDLSCQYPVIGLGHLGNSQGVEGLVLVICPAPEVVKMELGW